MDTGNTSSYKFRPAIEPITLDGWMTARVIGVTDSSDAIAVVIPKLMPTVDEYSEMSTVTINLNHKVCINKVKPEISANLKFANFYEIQPLQWNRQIANKDGTLYGTEDRKVSGRTYFNSPPLGMEEVLIMFLDSCPEKCYYLPFSPTIYPMRGGWEEK